MTNQIIQVRNLSKRYRIGSRQEAYGSLRESVTNAFAEVINRVRNRQTLEQVDTIWALKDVSFDVQPGEVVGIIGRNGAGKSTLLKILSRITKPTEGMVRLHGRVGSLLEVGTGFHPELTGRENIHLNGAILGMSRVEIASKFDEIVDFAEIEKFLDTPVKRYSSGMYVRLAFAVAAHLEPEILLVDEVLSVGDAAFQKKCLGKMGDVANEGRTVLFVSHNMGAVSSLCRRGILIEKGSITVQGSIDETIAKYIHGDNSHTGTDSIINHPNRIDAYQSKLTSFSLEPHGETIYYGKPLELRIGYQFDESVTVPQFCVDFQTVRGITAFTLISDYQQNEIPGILQGVGEVVCNVHFLPLLPGDYSIGLKLWQPGLKLDEINNVKQIRVEWLERELGQFNWNSSLGVVYVEADWHLLER